MAPKPLGSRKAAKTVRNLALAEAALALVKSGGRSSKRVSTKVLLIGGGAIAAAGAAALLGRKKVAGLWPSGGEGTAPASPVPPQPSNYDAPGPPANTATPIPAPDPHGEPPAHVDPAAEEAAAAAEAGAIGGETGEYAGPAGDPADEALRPLAEAGEGESEGLEQAEAELAENATDTEPSPSDAERQIDDAIEQAGQPQSGESLEPPADLAAPVDETSPEVPGGGISGRPHAGLDETPGAPSTGDAEPEEGSEPAATSTPGTPPTQDDDDGGEYRTWSGDAVKP